MSLNATPDNLYPLATAGGIAIPLDVARPLAYYPVTNLAAELSLTLPQEINVCEVIFNADVVVYSGTWPGTPVNGASVVDAYRCVAGLAYDLALPKNIKIRPVGGAASGHINVVETWVQLQNTNYGAS